MSNIDIPSTIVSTVSVHRHADGSTTWTASPQLANTIEMLEVVLAQMQAACGSREGRPCRGWIASDATLISTPTHGRPVMPLPALASALNMHYAGPEWPDHQPLDDYSWLGPEVGF